MRGSSIVHVRYDETSGEGLLNDNIYPIYSTHHVLRCRFR